ncbi:MAG: DUF5996 family protein [Armatimonadota bacterium]
MLYVNADLWRPNHDPWPDLPLNAWSDTYATLHRWLQIVGKIRMTLSPPTNHWWHCTLFVTPRGLTTTSIPYRNGAFQIDFDFIDHQLLITASTGHRRCFPLRDHSVAAFYHELRETLAGLGIQVQIRPVPDEVPDRTPFYDDELHATYDPGCAERCWRILLQADRVLRQFRSGFVGKCSPVQLFWGSFDLAVTRFSGRRAPERPGADAVEREAYSHEQISCGFWPGSPPLTGPAFYAYSVPSPPGLEEAPIEPEGAYFSRHFSEFILPYDVVREARDPDAAVHRFLESTYEHAARMAGWDRALLERHGRPDQPVSAAA